MESNLKIHNNFKFQGKSFSDHNLLIDEVESVSKESAEFLKEWFNNKLFVKVNTSGSTGIPKEIKLKKRQMLNSANATASFLQLKENTTALLCLSSSFIAGKMMWVRALTLGWHLDVVSVDSNPLALNSKSYDFTAMVPMQVSNSIDQLFRVKKIIIGGGVVSENLQNKLQSISAKAYATYGMTETITHIAIKKLNKFNEDNMDSFEVLPSVSIESDSRGCLVIDAPLIADEKIITNDLVTIISNNRFKWLGRYDSIINSGGVKLIPEEIEKKISNIITERFFVASLPDTKLGEKLILVVEGDKNRITSKIDILAFIGSTELTTYEIPKEIHFVSKFSMTETGKIMRSSTMNKIF